MYEVTRLFLPNIKSCRCFPEREQDVGNEERRGGGSSRMQGLRNVNKQNNLRGLYSASELYRLTDRHLFAKFSANFCG
jgi:hypothetical protein